VSFEANLTEKALTYISMLVAIMHKMAEMAVIPALPGSQ